MLKFWRFWFRFFVCFLYNGFKWFRFSMLWFFIIFFWSIEKVEFFVYSRSFASLQSVQMQTIQTQLKWTSKQNRKKITNFFMFHKGLSLTMSYHNWASGQTHYNLQNFFFSFHLWWLLNSLISISCTWFSFQFSYNTQQQCNCNFIRPI